MNKDKIKEEFDNLMFATCPVEIKEPFFWRWTEHEKEILEEFILSRISEAISQHNELLIKKIEELLPEDKTDMTTYGWLKEDIITLIKNSK